MILQVKLNYLVWKFNYFNYYINFLLKNNFNIYYKYFSYISKNKIIFGYFINKLNIFFYNININIS